MTIKPIFYEIRDRSGELKGCLLGSAHELKGLKKTLADAPDIFESSSKVQKCFQNAKRLAVEFNPQDMFSYNPLVKYFTEQPHFDIKQFERGVHESHSIDGQFIVHAIQQNKPITSLETLSEVFKTNEISSNLEKYEIRKPYFPYITPEMYKLPPDPKMYKLPPGIGIQKCNELSHSMQLFDDRSEKLMENYKTQCLFPIEQLSIQDRDQKMTSRMNNLLQQEGTTFITVGAMHLPGKNGICELLRENGYQVNRIFEENRRSTRSKWLEN